jgi:tRNA-(ms[2]io[6]A)-hydroxylase
MTVAPLPALPPRIHVTGLAVDPVDLTRLFDWVVAAANDGRVTGLRRTVGYLNVHVANTAARDEIVGMGGIRPLVLLLEDDGHHTKKFVSMALARLAKEHEATQTAIAEAGAIAPLVALAHEETEHFDQVHTHLRARGGSLSLPDSDLYVASLRKAASKDHGDLPVLLDRLLVSALVEARSCERFRLLAERLKDASLRTFYKDLMASEARHFRLFARLAEERFGELDARARLATLAEREADLAGSLPLGPTVHG